MKKRSMGSIALTVGALGVVFGDIGTSPLYALQAIFGIGGRHVPVNTANIYGIISLIIWSITLAVSVKFIGYIMRADNEGEGGIMALVARIKSTPMRHKETMLLVGIGIVGVSLFYGDSAITPAISVLSAVEGVRTLSPHLTEYIVPVTIAILTALFWLQQYGTARIGQLFGPIMLVWFATIGCGGLWRVVQHPDILRSLLPTTALSFVLFHPLVAFVALAAVVLAITGAEALYADLGHFGRPPIARAWFFVVFPALVLCYMGQGTLLLHNGGLQLDLLVQLFPESMHALIVLLATFATLIASQSVISGAFSLTKQAMQLNFLPKMVIHHTSTTETGQIYVPAINLILFIAVIFLVIFFGSSVKLANAYGIAVSGTLLIDTILFLSVVKSSWHRPRKYITTLACLFLPLDIAFVAATSPKIFHGGLFPIGVAIGVYIVLDTWINGEKIIAQERRSQEGSLESFIGEVHTAKPPVIRAPGEAVYIGHHPAYVPLALRDAFNDFHELPEKVAIVNVETSTAAHIPKEKRITVETFKHGDGISHVTITYGFHDLINVPLALEEARQLHPALLFDIKNAAYFISLSKVVITERHNMIHWRKALYGFLSHNRLSTSDYYGLPVNRTEEVLSLIKL